MGRLRLVLAALLLSSFALALASLESVPLRAVERWEQEHPDPSTVGAADVDTVLEMVAQARHVDLLLLLAGLAVGCALVAARPSLASSAGGTWVAILATGSLAVGILGLATSATSQALDAGSGHWSLSDDVLPRLAGPHAATLRAWRERIAEDDAVLLLGSDPHLWDAVHWALHPRAIHPRVLEVPREMGAAEIAAAARSIAPPHDGTCWLIDLGVLASAEGAGHPALVRVSP